MNLQSHQQTVSALDKAMGSDYAAFLENKKVADIPTGHSVALDALNPNLFAFEQEEVCA